MKQALLLLGAFGAFTAGAFGQNLIAHWDLDRDDKISGTDWKPKATFAYDESPFKDCVDLKMKTHVGWSSRYGGSEHTPDYHCFGVFDGDLNYSQFVSWKVTFSGDAMGELSSFNFDIRNYGGGTDAFVLAWFDSAGTMLGSEGGTFGDDWEDFTVDVSGAGMDSAFGSSDMYEFRLFAYDKNISGKDKVRDSGRIGLDNIRIHGDGVKCIPEPGTAVLGLLALVPFVLRRRR